MKKPYEKPYEKPTAAIMNYEVTENITTSDIGGTEEIIPDEGDGTIKTYCSLSGAFVLMSGNNTGEQTVLRCLLFQKVLEKVWKRRESPD